MKSERGHFGEQRQFADSFNVGSGGEVSPIRAISTGGKKDETLPHKNTPPHHTAGRVTATATALLVALAGGAGASGCSRGSTGETPNPGTSVAKKIGHEVTHSGESRLQHDLRNLKRGIQRLLP